MMMSMQNIFISIGIKLSCKIQASNDLFCPYDSPPPPQPLYIIDIVPPAVDIAPPLKQIKLQFTLLDIPEHPPALHPTPPLLSPVC